MTEIEQPKPNYYAIIPAEVRYGPLSANAKLLYGEISALANKTGLCWASNQYFATLYNASKDSVSRWLSELAREEYILLTQTARGGRQICLGGSAKMPRGVGKNAVPTEYESERANTTSNNTNKTVPKGTGASPKIDIEDPLLRESFALYASHRKSMRKPLTVQSQPLILKKLERMYPGKPEKQAAVLLQSVENSWQGIFELKDNKNEDPRFPSSEGWRT